MARCSIWPPARKAMATPSRSGSGAANGPSTRKRKDRTTRKDTPLTDTSRLPWQLLMVGPGIGRITPDIQDKPASLQIESAHGRESGGLCVEVQRLAYN